MSTRKYKLFSLGLPKTLLFNFHYFNFKTAIKLPVWMTHKVRLKSLKGEVILQTEKIRRGMITIGYQHVSINDINEYSLWNVEGKVVFKGRAGFGAGAKIAVGKVATLTFGDHFLMTARSEIACFKEIQFGDHCLLSWNILIMDTDAHPVYDEEANIINQDQPIIIGNKVWIGCRSTILKGTVVADGCIIGTGALLNKKFSNKN
ncbi:MAG: acyltransferase, partial [Ignavibacterium sp.]